MGEYIYIRGGEFTMGRNNGEHEDQRPEHPVEVSSFYIGRTPITNEQFVTFLNESSVESDEYPYAEIKWAVPSVTHVNGTWDSVPSTERDAANCGNSDLAQRFCDWLSVKSGRKCRLPTEAEWEYVCRGKEGRRFPWGDEETDLENRVWEWRTWRRTKPNCVPVGSFPKGATPQGVCDLVGYMDEICSDWYDAEYYAKSPRMNPQGPDEPVMARGQTLKVTRGGLEHEYSAKGVSGYFRVSELYGVLPKAFLPRGWSKGKISVASPKNPSSVYGRLGLRVVIECVD